LISDRYQISFFVFLFKNFERAKLQFQIRNPKEVPADQIFSPVFLNDSPKI